MQIIEVRYDADALRTITNDIGHNVHVMNALREAGIPIHGVLLLRSVKTGLMTMQTVDDIDGDIYVWKWYSHGTHDKKGQPVAYGPMHEARRGQGKTYSWIAYAQKGAKHVAADDEF
jgi:hypothetical protein